MKHMLPPSNEGILDVQRVETVDSLMAIGLENREPLLPAIHHSDNIINIPNGMTAYRAAEGVGIPIHMVKGGRHATVRALIAGVGELESQVARRIEPHFPGRGYSNIGKRADPIVDAEFAAGLTAGILFSRRASLGAKLAAGITGVKIGKQSQWAANADKEHETLTGEPYVSNVKMTGKLATVAMIASGVAGALTHDLNPLKSRQKS